MDINAVEVWSIDGTDHQVGIRNMYVNEKGNLVIETSADAANTSNGNINIESMKNIQLKPSAKGDIRLYSDHCNDLEQITVHAFDGTKTVTGSKDDVPIRLKVNATEVEINTKDAVDRTTGAKIQNDGTDVKYKAGSSYIKARQKASSHDIRCYTSGKGTGGGIAVQISSCDSDYKENKFKIETDRIAPIGNGNATSTTYSSTYNGEGGKGMEILTINSQIFSAFNGSYRFNASAPIYAVTRGALTTDANGKTDFPTQSDDSKDIINDASPITWEDVIKAVKFLKNNGSIS